ncbi:ParA family protein [Infirmifilum sp.]|uniref:ParA family protein n=1 Tax=Infirmifilum sp. TaxID=2856575 RepID=UPI003D0DD4EF
MSHHSPANKKPLVITVTNQKGGTGKTTLTALLAYGLAERGYNVLMLDLDPQAHLSSFFLKINEIESINDGVIELAQNKEFHIRKLDLRTKGTIALVPSGLNYIMKVYRGELPFMDPYAAYKRISREPAITNNYDYVICDSPPELFTPTIWGLYAADFILIPTNLEELSLAGVKLLIKDVLPDIMYTSRRDLKILGVALINVTGHHRSDSKVILRLKESLIKFLKTMPRYVREKIHKDPLFNTIIYRYEGLKDLPYRPRRYEIPLKRVIESNTKLYENIRDFTKELLDRVHNFEGLQ